MEDLYLPPRSRKTLQKVNQEDGKGDKSKKDESNDSSYDGSDEDQPRKRGRPRAGTKEIVKGFTDAEVCIEFTFFFFFLLNFKVFYVYFYRFVSLLKVVNVFLILLNV